MHLRASIPSRVIHLHMQAKVGTARAMALSSEGMIPSSMSHIKFGLMFTTPGWFKMAECLVLLGPVMKYLLQGFLAVPQRKALFEYLDALGMLWCRHVETATIPRRVEAVALALAGMEARFPAWELNFNRHSILHVAQAMVHTGPPTVHTTLPYERLWGRLGKWLNQTVHPELVMLNHYRAYKLAASFNLKSRAADLSDRESDGEDDMESYGEGDMEDDRPSSSNPGQQPQQARAAGDPLVDRPSSSNQHAAFGDDLDRNAVDAILMPAYVQEGGVSAVHVRCFVCLLCRHYLT